MRPSPVGLAGAHFDIRVAERRGVATMDLAGELDLAAEHEFEQKLERLLTGSPEHVVIDLRGLTFIDSSGLRSIVQAYSRSRRAGCKMWIVRGGPQVSGVLQLSGVENFLPMVDEPPELPG